MKGNLLALVDPNRTELISRTILYFLSRHELTRHEMSSEIKDEDKIRSTIARDNVR